MGKNNEFNAAKKVVATIISKSKVILANNQMLFPCENQLDLLLTKIS
jgi:hypothetical protein